MLFVKGYAESRADLRESMQKSAESESQPPQEVAEAGVLTAISAITWRRLVRAFTIRSILAVELRAK
jgi:hypothetical protein